ncbi:Nucleotide-binding universal stress protein, UspA family [Halogranum gelatinilyticum]|uniref:Nucleotide-binding universal stress protein, UspA family n=1 Tax=Halogranum gelatinilyticum TaxID=660521 RepID=A0A1G9XNL3_9EURY|nr:universal stress protein [Halogranum gelatinilyticum]SDM98377.1 Nucleotide-binding universal stress protein, UspA family [Halogranum gelatinilyticum]
MYDTILVPTDGSDAAMNAVDHAVDLARQYDATLHVLAVVDPTSFSTLDVDPSTVVVAMERQAREAAQRVETVAEEAGVAIETAVVRGDPARTITTYATDNEADLVVMGTHGRSGLDRYLLGSVTERVVRTADVPVLTVRYEE